MSQPKAAYKFIIDGLTGEWIAAETVNSGGEPSTLMSSDGEEIGNTDPQTLTIGGSLSDVYLNVASKLFAVPLSSPTGTAALRSDVLDGTTIVNTAVGLVAASGIYGFNGSANVPYRSFDSGASPIDSDSAVTGFLGSLSLAYGFRDDGAQESWEALQTTSPTSLSGGNVGTALITAPPGNWTLTSAPAADTIATATKAGVAGDCHVLTSINATITAVAAIAAPITVVIRDGLTGVGTILWQDRLTAPAGADGRVSLSGLSIVGTAGNAMTVEFTAAPGATNFETLSATGYTAV